MYDSEQDKNYQNHFFYYDNINHTINLYDSAVPASKKIISKFSQTTFVRQHITYETKYVFELSNGAIFYKNCIISTNDAASNDTLYYIVDVEFEAKKKLIDCLQKGIQTNIRTMSMDDIKPQYTLIVHIIKKEVIDDQHLWYFDSFYEEFNIDPNQNNDHIRRVFDFDYENIQYEKTSDNCLIPTDIKIDPPQEQHELVQNKGMFLFMQWTADGATFNWNQDSMTNSLIHVANNKLGKQTNNLWRVACSPKCIPQRYIIHSVCEDLIKLRNGFVIWRCNDNHKSFIQENCAGTLGVTVNDGWDRYNVQLSVSASAKNKTDGRLFLEAYQIGMPYPNDSCNLRQFGIQIPYQWKDYLHTLVHETINERISPKKWKKFPNAVVTKGCGITASPWKIWYDWNGNKFEWNFLRGGVAEYFHITASGMVTKLFEETYKSFKHQFLKENYQLLIEFIYKNNACLKDKKLSNFDKLTHENNMCQQYAKWFYSLITLPYLVDFKDGIDELIQLIRLVSRIVICNNEYDRQLIHAQSQKLFKVIKNKYNQLNTPKFRLLKETIDLDLFLYNNISLIQGLYSEHGHQFTKKIKQHRSNHTKTNFEDLLHFLSINSGLVYLINGGHYGRKLDYCLGADAMNLKHPDDPSKPHPLIEEFLLNTNKYNTDNADPTISIYKQIYVQNISLLSETNLDFFWDEWLLDKNFDEFTSHLPSENKNLFDICCCRSIFIDDGKKSNSIIFNYSKYKSIFDNKINWNYWFKMRDNKIVNIELIFKITSKDNTFGKILAYGTMYNINSATFYNEYQGHSKYNEFIDTFDKNAPLQSKWFNITKTSLIESVVIVHQHIKCAHLQKKYKQSFVKVMKQYTHNIEKNEMLHIVPCGPIQTCQKHSNINCKNSECRLRKTFITQWFCNTMKSNIFLIYDSRNAWLPGIWHQNNKTRDSFLVT